MNLRLNVYGIFVLILLLSLHTSAQDVPPPVDSKYTLLLESEFTNYGNHILTKPDHLKGVLTDEGNFVGVNIYQKNGISYAGFQSIDIFLQLKSLSPFFPQSSTPIPGTPNGYDTKNVVIGDTSPNGKYTYYIYNHFISVSGEQTTLFYRINNGVLVEDSLYDLNAAGYYAGSLKVNNNGTAVAGLWKKDDGGYDIVRISSSGVRQLVFTSPNPLGWDEFTINDLDTIFIVNNRNIVAYPVNGPSK